MKNKDSEAQFLINNPLCLDNFRMQWNGKEILKLLGQYHGHLCINWDVGVGKSYNIDEVIEVAIGENQYDLVVSLSPTRQLINERRWIRNPPADLKIVNLRPRPKKNCGKSRNQLWQQYETRGLGLLGRQDICKYCPTHKSCFWPNQYGKALRGARVIYGTQTHIERSTIFIEQLRRWSKAATVLALIDEVGFICKPLQRIIAQVDIIQTLTVARRFLESSGSNEKLSRWIYLLGLLLRAPTSDLRCDDWDFFGLSPKLVIKLQEIGRNQYGDTFKYIGYDLTQFSKSIFSSREKLRCNDISFAIQPLINCDSIIYSGTASSEFLQFRIGKEFANPFQNYSFKHKETVWYNIASRIGARRYFFRNIPQILDFFAQLIGKRISEGKRPMLIVKKRFIDTCINELKKRLKDFGFDGIKIVKVGKKTNVTNRNVVPIINYGMIGTNKFEHFDCAFCLSGYYVNEHIINSILQDIVASDQHIPIKIKTSGIPRRRTVKVINYKDRFYDVNRLAQLSLNQQEIDVVLQAAGRVRPYTKPREVITFQCSDHPRLTYTREFDNLGEARSFFSLASRSEFKSQTTRQRVKEAKDSGMTQREASLKVGLSMRTIKRHWS